MGLTVVHLRVVFLVLDGFRVLSSLKHGLYKEPYDTAAHAHLYCRLRSLYGRIPHLDVTECPALGMSF